MPRKKNRVRKVFAETSTCEKCGRQWGGEPLVRRGNVIGETLLIREGDPFPKPWRSRFEDKESVISEEAMEYLFKKGTNNHWEQWLSHVDGLKPKETMGRKLPADCTTHGSGDMLCGKCAGKIIMNRLRKKGVVK